jgi:hypothetical protein
LAEVTAMRNNALPYPMYGLAWTITFPFLDADGDLVTAATTPDAERSLNGDTFADCTNESTEIATGSGVYYLTLTAAEMTADIVTVIAKSATAGMKTTVATLYPRKLVQFKASATSAAGAAGTITFDSGASTIDDFYNGMVIVATIDTLVETRIITDYVGSTKVASVTPNWNVTPDSDDTFIVYLTPEMSAYAKADVLAWNSAAVASPHTAGYPVVTVKDGTGAGEIDTTSGGVLVAAIAANAITATSINADAITAAKIADGAIDAATFAANAITSTVVANDFITAAKVAADVSAEIADAVWDEDATGHQTGGTFGQAIGDPGADTTTIYQSVVTDAAGANVAADIIAIKAQTAAIETDTAEIGAAGAGLTAINLPDQTMNITGNITGNLSGSVGSVTGAVGSVTGNVGGTINGLTATALADFFDTDSGTTYASAVAGSVVAEIADNAGGSALTAEAIADAVWDEDATGHQTQGTFGQAIGDPAADANTIYGAVVTGAAGATIAADIIAVKAETVTILADTNELQTDWTNGGRLDLIIDDILVDTAEIGAAGAGLTNINLPNQTMDIVGNITGNLSGSVGSVTGAVGSVTGNVGGTINGLTATAIKDFFDTDSTTTYASAVAGSVVKEIADNAGGASLTVNDIVAGVWSEALPGAFGAGEAGKIVGDNINATISSRATQTSVDDLPTNAELTTALGTADDAVLAAIGDLPTAVENADALLDRDMSTGTDSGSSTVRTVRQALRFSRNKFAISGGTLTVYKEDDSTSSWTSAVTTTAGDPVTASDPAGP